MKKTNSEAKKSWKNAPLQFRLNRSDIHYSSLQSIQLGSAVRPQALKLHHDFD
jgi:hypothetical protein